MVVGQGWEIISGGDSRGIVGGDGLFFGRAF